MQINKQSVKQNLFIDYAKNHTLDESVNYIKGSNISGKTNGLIDDNVHISQKAYSMNKNHKAITKTQKAQEMLDKYDIDYKLVDPKIAEMELIENMLSSTLGSNSMLAPLTVKNDDFEFFKISQDLNQKLFDTYNINKF